MRAPAFWFDTQSPLRLILSPLGWLYDQGGKFLRNPVVAKKFPIPILCVGNITMGGAGKTPVVTEIVTRLRAKGSEVHILSRGYGGSEKGPLRVDPSRHTAAQVGDEALMLSRIAPVWVARNKKKGARAAIAGGAKALVLDDGLQNPTLVKDISLLVMDARQGLGNGKIFPAGPLREYPEDALRRIEAVIFIGNTSPPLAATRTPKPFLRATAQTIIPEGANKAVYAFCGIGIPQKFYDGLKEAGATVKGTKSFADHHPFSRQEIENIIAEARKMGATPITTLKDSMRIPPDLLPSITVCDLKLVWRDAAAFDKLMNKIHAALC